MMVYQFANASLASVFGVVVERLAVVGLAGDHEDFAQSEGHSLPQLIVAGEHRLPPLRVHAKPCRPGNTTGRLEGMAGRTVCGVLNCSASQAVTPSDWTCWIRLVVGPKVVWSKQPRRCRQTDRRRDRLFEFRPEPSSGRGILALERHAACLIRGDCDAGYYLRGRFIGGRDSLTVSLDDGLRHESDSRQSHRRGGSGWKFQWAPAADGRGCIDNVQRIGGGNEPRLDASDALIVTARLGGHRNRRGVNPGAGDGTCAGHAPLHSGLQ